MLILTAAFFSICVFYIVWFLIEHYFGSESHRERDQIIKARIFSASLGLASDQSHKIEKKAAYGFLDKFFDEKSFFKRAFPLLLARAGISVSVSFFVIFSVGLGLIAFFATNYFLNVVDAQIVAAAVVFLPFFYLKIMNQIYLKKFQQFLPDAMAALSSSIKVGHGLQVGLDAAIEASVYPVKQEFLEIQGELKLGIPTQIAFLNLYSRIPTPEVRIFCMGIAIHEELGGNLSEVLDNLERTIRQRFELEREINVLSAQGKFSIATISLIPLVVAGFMYLSDKANFTSYLASDMGKLITKINIAAMTVGFIWMRKIVDLRD